MNQIPVRRDTRQRGLTLIELMVGLTISLVVLSALTTFFVSSLRNRAELNRANELVENGRFTVRTLVSDLQLAGYLAEFNITDAITNPAGALAMPADLPAACATDPAQLRLGLAFPLQGFDDPVASPLDCISDWRAGTDVVVVRRVSTCAIGEAGCGDVAGAPYFQVSRCNAVTEIQGASNLWFDLDTDLAELDRTARDCATLAARRRYRTHIYFVANNDLAGDGVPTLKRAELRGGDFSIEPLANGVENLQIEYGIDTNGDGAPDQYSTNPSTFGACGAAACRMANWRNVTVVKFNLLIRSLTESRSGASVAKTFTLGRDVNGDAVTAGPFSDGYKRHAFQSVVMLKNVVGQRR